MFGLGDQTWTDDLTHPMRARYQLRHTQKPTGQGDQAWTDDLSVPNAARYQLRHTLKKPQHLNKIGTRDRIRIIDTNPPFLYKPA